MALLNNTIMKNSLIISTILILVLTSTFNLSAVVKNQGIDNTQVTHVFELENDDLIQLSRMELEAEVGRKLSFKEKIVLKFVKKKLRKHPELNGVQAAEEVKVSGLAIASFVFGIVGLLIAGIIFGTLGVIFSSIALAKIKNNPDIIKGKGLAIAGLV